MLFCLCIFLFSLGKGLANVEGDGEMSGAGVHEVKTHKNSVKSFTKISLSFYNNILKYSEYYKI